MKAVICAIAKFEYDYIYEWVKYNLNLGFDKIVVYDNNDEDGERYDELLSEFIEKGQVEIRDVRGQRAMQRPAYNQFYHEGDFDWVAFIDIDEFITFNETKYKSIKDFIETKSNFDAIFLYWKTYGDAGKTYPTEIYDGHSSVLTNYNIPANENCLIDSAIREQNAWGKSIIKSGLNITYLHEHFVTNPMNLKYGDSLGGFANPYLFFPNKEYVKATYNECYIKHIYTKSLYEYINCKVKRPAANAMNNLHFPDKYFKVNEINEEKRRYLESLGYKMEFKFKPDAYVIIEVKNLEEYYKLKPYIYNIINLCSCRFYLCVTEDDSAINIISNEISGKFNECSIYINHKKNVLTEFETVFYDDRSNIVKHSNCIVHLNIPYNVDTDAYISKYIDPLFNDNNIEHNFIRLFNTDNALYVPKCSIKTIDKTDNTFIKYNNALNKVGVKTNLLYIAETGNFIAKTSDVLKWKDIYWKANNESNNELQNPGLLLYFISGMFDTFIYTE